MEGDAVFTYAVKENGEQSWGDIEKKIGEKLITFSRVFSERVFELSESNICDCNACNNVDKLKLKLVAHSGEALLYKIGRFYELS